MTKSNCSTWTTTTESDLISLRIIAAEMSHRNPLQCLLRLSSPLYSPPNSPYGFNDVITRVSRPDGTGLGGQRRRDLEEDMSKSLINDHCTRRIGYPRTQRRGYMRRDTEPFAKVILDLPTVAVTRYNTNPHHQYTTLQQSNR